MGILRLVSVLAILVLSTVSQTAAAGSGDILRRVPESAAARAANISWFRLDGPYARWRRDVLKVRRCGATEYYCDDIAFPDCRYDSSEDDWYCAPDDVIVCDNPTGWDYWCNTDQYCCTGGCCR